MNNIISINELWQFFNRSANLFCISGPDGYLRQVNPHMVNLLGHCEQELLSEPYLRFIHEEDRAYSILQSARVRSTTSVVLFKNRILTASGDYRWISWTATFIPNENHVYLIGQDHTDQLLIAERLASEKLNRQKNILEAREKERAEIGKELHDNVNQMLATVILYHQIALSEKGPMDDMIRKSADIVKAVINEIRSLSRVLVSNDWEEIGLVDKITDLIDTFQLTTSISLMFKHAGQLEKLPTKQKKMLFRILQEQLNNIQKHAEAKNVIVQLLRTKDELSLTITDNGKGFEAGKIGKGIGLLNMRSRVRECNGSLQINTAPGKGCMLKILIPSEMVCR